MVGGFMSFKNEGSTAEIILTKNEMDQYLYSTY
jgi:hypothetical protein